MIDIMAPGGRFIFNFDKSAMSLDTINIENYAAVIQYVAENTNYQNAGATARGPENTPYEKPDTTVSSFASPFYTNWKDVPKTEIEASLESTVDPLLQSYEDMLYRMIFTII